MVAVDRFLRAASSFQCPRQKHRRRIPDTEQICPLSAHFISPAASLYLSGCSLFLSRPLYLSRALYLGLLSLSWYVLHTHAPALRRSVALPPLSFRTLLALLFSSHPRFLAVLLLYSCIFLYFFVYCIS